MPIYELLCRKCLKQKEVFTFVPVDEILEKCPDCGGVFEKMISKCVARFATGEIDPYGEKKTVSQQKPRQFKHDYNECNASADIWQSVINDGERGKLKKGEAEYWKKELKKDGLDI